MAALAPWAGAGFCLAGAWLLRSAWARRARARAAMARGLAAPPLAPSLAMMGEMMPPIIRLGLILAGLQGLLAYGMTGGVFSLFDLAGFLFLLLAYDLWLRCRTRYRLPDAAG
ncbi:hypothetical protein [Roseicella frigidaeris]|uniref:Uncharacterized protein n=1 Tax=Roseicella frigidaeris TaxID=2230885 RepID=A0A327M667_9PROT|nr:hypothetical protein [Roseicella frigidaeris]RAI57673.1 hypothetical protein DOO78_17935 [Roseicella frigidaeris]